MHEYITGFLIGLMVGTFIGGWLMSLDLKHNRR